MSTIGITRVKGDADIVGESVSWMLTQVDQFRAAPRFPLKLLTMDRAVSTVNTIRAQFRPARIFSANSR